MAKYILYFFLVFSTTMYSQEEMAKDTIYNADDVDVKPDYDGGIQKFLKYVVKNFQLPDEEGLNGKVIVEFVIEKNGEVTNINVIQDVGFGSAENAIKLFKKCPKWIPGKKNGELVRTRYRFPLSIRT